LGTLVSYLKKVDTNANVVPKKIIYFGCNKLFGNPFTTIILFPYRRMSKVAVSRASKEQCLS